VGDQRPAACRLLSIPFTIAFPCVNTSSGLVSRFVLLPQTGASELRGGFIQRSRHSVADCRGTWARTHIAYGKGQIPFRCLVADRF